MLLLLIKVMITLCTFTMSKGRRCFLPFQLDLILLQIFNGLKNPTILNLWLSHQDLSNFGILLMLAKNCTKMVLLDQSSHKLNSIVLLLMKMVSVTQVVLMVVFMFGIKNKILVLSLKLMLVKLLLLLVLKVFLYPQEKMICYQFSLLIKVNINF